MLIIDPFLEALLEAGGSDLHLSVGSPPKVRIDGNIVALEHPNLDTHDLENILKLMTPAFRWNHFMANNDCDFAYEFRDLARFRVNLFRNHWGYGAVLRRIPSKIQGIDELCLPPVLKKIANYRDGLVLVTGATGSGKSTTLAAMIDYINDNFPREIITVEDPVEFSHQNKQSTIIHREVGEHAKSFSLALRGAMRADPDVILIGEMRNQETMKLALNCAAMGMLVFATLHTNTAPKTIDRIIDAFPAEEQNQVRVMLAESLKAIISQTLCKCANGGRIPAFEILVYVDSLPYCIRQNALASIQNIIDQNRALGMISMDNSLRELLKIGQINPQEAYMKAIDKSAFTPPVNGKSY